MVEQRVISQKIGARPGAPLASAPPEPASDAVVQPGGRRRLLVVLMVVVLVGAGAVAYVLGRGDVPPPGLLTAPAPGAVLTVDPVSINLAEGHYLRLGLALQLTDAVEGEPDASRALDLAIALYSGRSVAEVSDPAGRDALKAELLSRLVATYGGEVMDLYLTDYVTQ